MNTQNRHPRWWQLSFLVPLMMALLLVDAHMRLFPWEHQVIEVGVVLLMYGALACWLWANQDALEGETKQQGGWQSIELAAGPAPDEMARPVLVEQNATNHSQLVEYVPLAAELQPIFSREAIRCAPPSGARLN